MSPTFARPEPVTGAGSGRREHSARRLAAMSGTYVVRTFGCQMNEHDSERIAGLLEADGLSAGDDVESADVVVLNTCCIRENADNKLYGTLGHLKSLKDRRPELEIVVAGCLAQKDRDAIAERAPHVDVVLGTHNVHRAVELLHERRESGRPVVEILEATVAEDHELFPSALPVVRQAGYAGWVTIQMGCDNSCAFCIVPAVRGPEISRPFGDIVAEVERAALDGVTEVTLLGQNVNSYGRDLTLRARATSPRRPARTPSFLLGGRRRRRCAGEGPPAVRRPAPCRRRRCRASAGSATPARIPRTCAPRRSARWPRSPSVCEHLHLPLQSGSDADARRDAPRLHRGALPGASRRRPGRHRRPGGHHRHHRRLPRRDRGRCRGDLEVAAEARFDGAFTFVYSPRPGTEAAGLVRALRAARGRGRSDGATARGRRAVVPLGNLERVGRIEEVLVVRVRAARTPTRLTGRTRQNRLVHFDPSGPVRPGSYVTVEVIDATTTHLRGHMVELVAAPTHRVRIPVAAE